MRNMGMVAIAMLALWPGVLAGQDRYAVGGAHVAIYNLAGEVTVVGTTAGQVTVEVRRGGRDGSDLAVEIGDVGGRQALRVIYPDTRIAYSGRGLSGTTTIRVRRDGTWGGRDGLSGSRSVRISSRGGAEAYADLTIGVPRGQRVDVYLGVGRITAENVDGVVRLDTHSAPVTARRMSGQLTIDTGSGRAEVTGMRGDLLVDTGSGAVRVSDVAGGRVTLDTGSGRVTATDVEADRLVIDTGSGAVDLRGAVAREARLDTGSGSVRAEFLRAFDRLVIDTGSGGVTLRVPRDLDADLVVDTGSGSINVDLPVRITRQARRELRGVLGAGGGNLRIDTGSGSVRIQGL